MELPILKTQKNLRPLPHCQFQTGRCWRNTFHQFRRNRYDVLWFRFFRKILKTCHLNLSESIIFWSAHSRSRYCRATCLAHILRCLKGSMENEPERSWREGYILSVRMEEYMESHLLFLHDSRVPPTNNTAERMLRAFKRKQVQAMSFRSFETIDYLCQCMSMLVRMRQNEDGTLYDRVARIFGWREPMVWTEFSLHHREYESFSVNSYQAVGLLW